MAAPGNSHGFNPRNLEGQAENCLRELGRRCALCSSLPMTWHKNVMHDRRSVVAWTGHNQLKHENTFVNIAVMATRRSECIGAIQSSIREALQRALRHCVCGSAEVRRVSVATDVGHKIGDMGGIRTRDLLGVG
ncbi:hypothetical protein Bbelb_000050 [Branchiostoma belcheri]|nr:hypothetical protein Bbelb_000050 [Branchiostoma belcheri]